MTTSLEEIERELDRIVDRLTSVALDRLPPIAEKCYATAQTIVDRTRPLEPGIPDVALPEVAPNSLGWQLAVVGRDYLNAARASGDPQAEIVQDALVELRRALP